MLKTRVTPKDLGRRLVGELWLYPDGSRIVELSTKCLPPEAFDVAVQLRSFLHARDMEPAEVQQTKTKKALEFFSDRLREDGPDQAAWRSCTWGVRRGSSVTVPPRTSQKASA